MDRESEEKSGGIAGISIGVLLGVLIHRSGLIDAAFGAIRRWLGHQTEPSAAQSAPGAASAIAGNDSPPPGGLRPDAVPMPARPAARGRQGR